MTAKRWKKKGFPRSWVFLLRTEQNLLWIFLLLLIWDEGTAADSKRKRFVFQPSASCWLFNGNSTWCWLFSFAFWPWIIRRTTYDLKTAFRIGSNRFEWWCRWWLMGFIFSSCFPLNKTKYNLYHDKKMSTIPSIFSSYFQSEPTIPMESLCVFIYGSSVFWLVLQFIPSVFIWFCK